MASENSPTSEAALSTVADGSSRPARPGQFHVIGIKFDVYSNTYLSNCSCGWNGPVPRATYYYAQADASEHQAAS